MIADPHFALCSVRAENCSRHGQCARAQLAPRNVRQAYCTPNGRGDACRLFFDFQPLKRLMLTPAGGATLAPSEIVVPGKTPTTDSANDAHDVARNRAQFGAAGLASSGGSQAINTAPADTRTAAPSLPVGMDTRQAFGVNEEDSARVTAPAVPSAAGDCPGQYFRERAELPSAGTTASSRPALDHSQLHAARLLRL